MDVTRITLVRHGAIDPTRVAGQRHDPDLTAAGRTEVGRLTTRLAGDPPDRVVRSPARRSATTARLLGHADATVDAAWAERDLGTWEARPWSQVWAQAPPQVQLDPTAFAAFTPPDGEPVADVRARVAAALWTLPDVDHVLVVTHAGPIVAAVAAVLDLDAATSLRLRVHTGTATRLTRFAGTHLTVDALGA